MESDQMTEKEAAEAGAIRRELGEVVGTLKMTVATVDKLTESVERLVERAAFKADLEALKGELHDMAAKDRIDSIKEIDSLKSKVAGLQKWMWMGMGALATIGALGKFIQFPARIVFGG